MAKMWDVRAKQFITVPEDRVEEFFRSGYYSFPSGTRVAVKLPTGEFGFINEDTAPLLFASGGSYDTAQARQHRAEVEEYGDALGTGVATGIGVARGLLTEPAADWLIAKTTPLTEEDIDAYGRANPWAAGGGEALGLLGGVGAAVMTGGSSVAAQGTLRTAAAAGTSLTAKQLAKKAALNLTPAVATARLGLKAEKVIGGALGLQKAGTFTRKAFGVGFAGAVGGGVEAASYSAIENISEEFLGDPSQTANEMLHEVGTFGMIGGLFGGAIGTVLGGGSVLLRGIRKTEQIAGAPVSVQAGKVMDRISAAIGKGDYTELRRLADDPEYAWKVLNGEDILDNAARDSALVFDDMVDTLAEVSSHTTGSRKAERMLREVAHGNEWQALDEGFQSLTRFQAALKEQLRNPAGIDVGALKQLRQSAQYTLDNTRKHLESLWGVKLGLEPGNAGAGWQVVTKKTVQTTDPVSGQITSKTIKEYTPMQLSPDVGPNPNWGENFSGHMFNELDEFKKIAGGPAYKAVGTKKGFNTRALLSDETNNLKLLLEDGAIWGEKAAEMQRVVNKAHSNLLRLWKEFETQFGGTVRGKRTGDKAKFRTLFKQIAGEETPPVRPGDTPGGATMVDAEANQLRIDELTDQMGGESAIIDDALTPQQVEAVQAEWDDLIRRAEDNLHQYRTGGEGIHPDWATEAAADLATAKTLRKTNRDPDVFFEDGFFSDAAKRQASLLDMGDEVADLTRKNAQAAVDLDPSAELIGPGNRTIVEETTRDKRLGETFRAYEAYIRAAEQQYGLRGGAKTLEKMAAMKGSMRELTDTVNGMRALKEMEKGGGLGLGTIGASAFVGGVPGILVGTAIAAITNPAKALRTRAALQGLKSKAVARRDLAINRAVSRIVKPSQRAVPGGIQYDKLGRVKEPWLKHLHHMGRIGQDEPKKKKEELRPVAAQARDTLEAVASLTENPERLNNVLVEGLTSIDGAPQLQSAIIQKTMENLQYCNQKLPVGMNRTADVLTGENKFLITDAAAHEYMQRVSTVNDWLGVLGPSLEAGVATPVMVEVAESVDPEGFERYRLGIRDGLLAHYQKTGQRPSLAMSGQLSTVLGIPISSAYAGPVLKIYQGFYRMPDKAQTQKSRMNALKQRPKDTMTKVQELGRA